MTTDPRKIYLMLATRRFAQDGFHGTSLARLAKEAGVSKQAILHFFGTKERLYAEVLNALCERLCADIKITQTSDPKSHLTAYYARMAASAMDDQQDVQLVVRALLDSDPEAQIWPLKPYLDRLADLVLSLPNFAETNRASALAEAYRFIGSVQYIALSLPTVQGIYGEATRASLAAAIASSVEREVERLTQCDAID
ncbi:TetR/AcrR family transcriptional regulator [Yoonia maritima]|uniref:TetR/AcrR family transcriptional regulator n=1 Tax=Yoonia maritima TaxID=1435347 RepID=UPI00373632B0